MRKAAAILLSALLLALLAAQFSACEKYVLPELAISPDTLCFTAEEGTRSLVVTTNVITTLYPDMEDTWVRVNPEWIEDGCTVSVWVAENPDTQQRIATIPVKSEAIKRNLVVIQEGSTPVNEP